MAPILKLEPLLPEVEEVLQSSFGQDGAPNLVPLCVTIPADLLTPTAAYLKISHGSKPGLSFLLESAATSETIGRYSFLGVEPRHTIRTGPGHGFEGDPLPLLAAELAEYRVAHFPRLQLPPLTAGAVGYVGYDCVKYFEPKTSRPLKDVLKVPEALFMFFDTIIAFDHFFQTIKIIAHLRVPSTLEDVPAAYHSTGLQIRNIAAFLQSPGAPLPKQLKGTIGASFTSNIGRQGYEDHVTALKKDILAGNIIQAVPSQRLSRPTTLHPFNIYRRLRTVNPSPYLFYIDCQDFQIIGASPELLVKTENNIEEGRIITHPIAGTILRGDTTEQDHKLAEQLRQSLKDRAEHVMLVDLARNDVNRVCDPLTTKVDRLMVVEKFSHVQHLVSQVSGVLRRQDGEGLHGEGMTRFDAFRSIFPAGTVSGAPKVRAMEIIAEREGEKRGVYAGAVGWWGYDTSRVKKGELDSMQETTIVREEGSMDTCIALRTMVMKDGVIYLQAGGGIVFDSDPAEEWMETINKLKANIMCVESAEEMYRDGEGDGTNADMWKKILLRDLETPAASVDMDVDQPHVEVGAA